MTGPTQTTEAWSLENWWKAERWRWKQARAMALVEDPGTPMHWGTATGEPTEYPWSAVLGARERLHRVINLDRLHRRLYELMGVKL